MQMIDRIPKPVLAFLSIDFGTWLIGSFFRLGLGPPASRCFITYQT